METTSLSYNKQIGRTEIEGDEKKEQSKHWKFVPFVYADSLPRFSCSQFNLLTEQTIENIKMKYTQLAVHAFVCSPNDMNRGADSVKHTAQHTAMHLKYCRSHVTFDIDNECSKCFDWNEKLYQHNMCKSLCLHFTLFRIDFMWPDSSVWLVAPIQNVCIRRIMIFQLKIWIYIPWVSVSFSVDFFHGSHF